MKCHWNTNLLEQMIHIVMNIHHGPFFVKISTMRKRLPTGTVAFYSKGFYLIKIFVRILFLRIATHKVESIKWKLYSKTYTQTQNIYRQNLAKIKYNRMICVGKIKKPSSRVFEMRDFFFLSSHMFESAVGLH